MKTSQHLGTRAVSFFLSILLVTTAIYAPSLAPKTYADDIPVIVTANVDPATIAFYAAQAAAAELTATNTTGSLIISNLLNGLAWAVAKAAIQSMTQSIVTWINSGFEGSPAFATDLRATLSDLGDAAANGFVRGLLENTSINSPFLARAVTTAARGYLLYTSRDRIVERIRYTLNQYSQNEEAFRRGQFNQGGFNAWFATARVCGNDPFCVDNTVQEELLHEVDAQMQRRLTELDWGRGFLSWRNCPDSTQSDGTDTTVGVTHLSSADRTAHCSINTPGSVIESQLEHQLGTGIRQLELADSINEIVGALASQLVSKVLGATGLLGTSEPSSGGGRSALEQAVNPSQTASTTQSLLNGFRQTITTELTQTTANQAAWQAFQVEILQAVGACAPDASNATKKFEATTARAQAEDLLAKAPVTIAALTDIQSQLATLTPQSSNYAAAASVLTARYNQLDRIPAPNQTLKNHIHAIVTGGCN